jgi:hypothetical protein
METDAVHAAILLLSLAYVPQPLYTAEAEVDMLELTSIWSYSIPAWPAAGPARWHESSRYWLGWGLGGCICDWWLATDDDGDPLVERAPGGWRVLIWDDTGRLYRVKCRRLIKTSATYDRERHQHRQLTFPDGYRLQDFQRPLLTPDRLRRFLDDLQPAKDK